MALFDKVMKFIFKEEGGKSDDAGGTNFGISKKSNPDVDIDSLTKYEAEMIYLTRYWSKYNYEWIKPEAIAAVLMDMAVNMGPGNSHRVLQRALNLVYNSGLKVDGHIGINTMLEIDKLVVLDVDNLMRAMIGYRFIYYSRCKQFKLNKRGWLKRALKCGGTYV